MAWRKLRLRKERERSGLILIEGLRSVGEALSSAQPVEAVLVADDHDGLAAASRLGLGRGTLNPESPSPQILRVARQEFEQMTDTVHSSGLAAVVGWRPLTWEAFAVRPVRRILYCDQMNDPGNLGTLIRTAAGLGLDGVLVSPESVEVTNPKVVRATAGAVFRLPIVSAVEVEQVGSWAGRQKFTIFLADVAHQSDPAPIPSPAKWILTIGGETHGLNPAWERLPCRRVGIRMSRGIESFNAGVAGALLMDRLMAGRDA